MIITWKTIAACRWYKTFDIYESFFIMYFVGYIINIQFPRQNSRFSTKPRVTNTVLLFLNRLPWKYCQNTVGIRRVAQNFTKLSPFTIELGWKVHVFDPWFGCTPIILKYMSNVHAGSLFWEYNSSLGFRQQMPFMEINKLYKV